jgi:CubicO group peptidase (beta-lactamase class C family)
LQGATHTLFSLRMKGLILSVAMCLVFARLHADPDNVSAALEKIRDDHNIPGLAAAVIDEGKFVAAGATGMRNAGRMVPVTLDDKWHLGSCTKSMTASVAAMLVEDGKIRWNTTVAEIFPDGIEEMNHAWRDVTLEQLLTHRGGAPHDPPKDLYAVALKQEGEPKEQRKKFIAGLLGRPPAKPPGTHFIYSDCGYSIAGAMLERASGEAWEDLMRKRLFEPLGLTSAGFGAPATPGKIDQPWGHRGYEAPFKPVPPGPDADYPPVFGPAATVHMSIADFAKYAQWHVEGARGDCRLLKAASFHKLHTTPDGQEYAMGWCVTKRRWAGGTALMHSGDNDMFRAVMWLGPRENTCFVAACNADNWEAIEACDDAVRMLINKY